MSAVVTARNTLGTHTSATGPFSETVMCCASAVVNTNARHARY